jgi:hypothetical protein
MRQTLDQFWNTIVDASPTVHATLIALFAVLAATLVANRAARRGAANALTIVEQQQKYDSEQRRLALVEDRVRRARDAALARDHRLEDLAEARAQRLLEQCTDAAREFSTAVRQFDHFVTRHDPWAVAAQMPASLVAMRRELAQCGRDVAFRAAPVRLLFGRQSEAASYAERCIADVELVTAALRSRLFAARHVLEAVTAGATSLELDVRWRAVMTENARAGTALAELGHDHAAFDEAALAFLEAEPRRDAESELGAESEADGHTRAAAANAPRPVPTGIVGPTAPARPSRPRAPRLVT